MQEYRSLDETQCNPGKHAILHNTSPDYVHPASGLRFYPYVSYLVRIDVVTQVW
jgi:hypothetical protein